MRINIFGGNSCNKEIDGNSNSPINTSSSNIAISGNNNSSINSNSGDIEIGGDNIGGINTSSGDIEVGGDNIGNINTSSGDIKIYGKNNGGINTSSGDIEVGGDSTSNIFTSSGDINIKGSNSGYIKTSSGNIKTQYNIGNISTLSGKIDIGQIKIRIKRNGCNISIGRTVSGMSTKINTVISGNSNIYISEGNVSIINGEVYVNGVKQDGNNDSKDNEYKIYIDDIEIDFYNKKATKDGNIIDITNEDELIRLLGNDIIVDYKGQLITIKQSSVNVLGK